MQSHPQGVRASTDEYEGGAHNSAHKTVYSQALEILSFMPRAIGPLRIGY